MLALTLGVSRGGGGGGGPAPSPTTTSAPRPTYGGGGGWRPHHHRRYYPSRVDYVYPPPTYYVVTDCVRDPVDPLNRCCPPGRVIDGRCALPVGWTPFAGATTDQIGMGLLLPAVGLIGLGILLTMRRERRTRRR